MKLLKPETNADVAMEIPKQTIVVATVATEETDIAAESSPVNLVVESVPTPEASGNDGGEKEEKEENQHSTTSSQAVVLLGSDDKPLPNFDAATTEEIYLKLLDHAILKEREEQARSSSNDVDTAFFELDAMPMMSGCVSDINSLTASTSFDAPPPVPADFMLFSQAEFRELMNTLNKECISSEAVYLDILQCASGGETVRYGAWMCLALGFNVIICLLSPLFLLYSLSIPCVSNTSILLYQCSDFLMNNDSTSAVL